MPTLFIASTVVILGSIGLFSTANAQTKNIAPIFSSDSTQPASTKSPFPPATTIFNHGIV
ncbi:MAG: hypothetical protein P4L61_03970 [Candidatus Pacebacteria bacterium]|nr:hypothetical protein [Candidatus Paceibacterota bacterium]